LPVDPKGGHDGEPLWGITSYYNPAGYGSRLLNYHSFRSRLKIPLVTVELSFGGGFQLAEGDADILVQLDDGDILWQKERLLNLAVEQLPDDCHKVVALDCDIVFADPVWADKAAAALDEHMVIQPFSRHFDLFPFELPIGETTSNRAPGSSSFFFHVLHEFQGGQLMVDGTGKALGFQRRLLDELGLYDARIMGGADMLMALSAVGAQQVGIELERMNEAEAAHFNEWAGAFHRAVDGNVGYVEGDLLSLWHGTIRDRRYHGRYTDIAEWRYDPREDIELSGQGCWQWASPKHGLHERIRSYFFSRREDGRYVRSRDGRVLMEVAGPG
jgi:hypothetical protein